MKNNTTTTAAAEQAQPTETNTATTAVVAADKPAAAAPAAVEVVGFSELESSVLAGKNLGDLKQLRVGTMNLKTEYKSFEEVGEVVRRVFAGFTMRRSVDPVTGEDKGLMPAALLYDPETETMNVCMQSVLVGVIRETRYPRGSAIQITYKGDRKGKNGTKFQNFDIRALIPVAEK